ncbi:DNA polymerase-1 [Nakamurella sp. UYEF19]|uniref:bifunctional 3'-5' exonuclease/DNA polymerase n=1 Tax=Nakamurella sp. UYEF19 TaxID=1756392 RepID=UPI0033912A29
MTDLTDGPAAGMTDGPVGPAPQNGAVIAAVVPAPGDEPGWLVQTLSDDGTPAAEPVIVRAVEDLRRWEASGARWLWDATEPIYPPLLTAGFSPLRCHDVTMTERILLGREGRHGEPASAGAVWARRHGLPVPADRVAETPDAHPALFAAALFGAPDPERADGDRAEGDHSGTGALFALCEAYVDQLARMGQNNPLKLLIAAESAAALAAVEMGHLGLPLRAEVLDGILTEMLGPRPAVGARPARMVELAGEIDAAFGASVNPDSPVDLRAAFRRVGFDIESTRSSVIKDLDHPATAPVLAYKELSRLFTANGWNWLAEWVRDGRFHAGYVPGGVVSGRWAARGGGALQIPKLVRRAVIAEPGYVFVVADAAQLEPRVLAAIAGDPALQAVSQQNDLYTALADDGFGGDRAHAKLAMLGAMYGATSGEAGRLLATLRRRYPVAMACVEDAARQGELGGVVSSVLGRTSPPPGQNWWDLSQAGSLPEATPAQERRARQIARDRGRFTRNFVVQGSAADWAGVWLSGLRRDLRGVPGAELVFFQHDEIVVHTPTETAAMVGDLTVAAAESARALVFPGRPVATPVRPVVVDCYADAK